MLTGQDRTEVPVVTTRDVKHTFVTQPIHTTTALTVRQTQAL